jgi:hypothetical protein
MWGGMGRIETMRTCVERGEVGIGRRSLALEERLGLLECYTPRGPYEKEVRTIAAV